MVTIGAGKANTSRKLAAIVLLAACICLPFMHAWISTAESKAHSSQGPNRESIASKPVQTLQDSGNPLHAGPADELFAQNPVQENPNNPARNEAVREDRVRQKPTGKLVANIPVQEAMESPSRKAAVQAEPTEEEAVQKRVMNSPVQAAPVRQEPVQQKPVANKKIKKNPADDYMVSDLAEAVRRQLMYAIRTPTARYACCIPPKNGCTYHFGLLYRISGIEDYESAPVVHNRESKTDFNMERFSPAEIRDWLEDDSIPKYVIVRNPMMRTLSAYLDKVEPNLPPSERTVDHFENWIMQEFPKGMTTSGERLKTNPHWRPQTEFCGIKSNLHRNFRVFHFEEPHDYVEYIYKIVPRQFLDDGWRGNDNVSLKEFMLGPKKRSGGTSSKFPKYFRSLRIFDHLARELRGDVDAFGYEKDVSSLRKQVIYSNRLGN